MTRLQHSQVEVEIVYDASGGYFPAAAWLAGEFYRSDAPGAVGLKLTPGGDGRLEVYLDGAKIFDRQEDGGFPDLNKVYELRMMIAEKVFQAEHAAGRPVIPLLRPG